MDRDTSLGSVSGMGKCLTCLTRSRPRPIPGTSVCGTQGRGTGLCQKKSINSDQTVSEDAYGKQSLSGLALAHSSRHWNSLTAHPAAELRIWGLSLTSSPFSPLSLPSLIGLYPKGLPHQSHLFVLTVSTLSCLLLSHRPVFKSGTVTELAEWMSVHYSGKQRFKDKQWLPSCHIN